MQGGCMNELSIADFIREITCVHKEIADVPCFCGHKTIAKRVVNQYLKDNPDDYTYVLIFCVYHKMRLAKQLREQANITNAFYNSLNAFSSINSEERLKYRSDMSVTNEIIQYIDDLITNEHHKLSEKESFTFNAVFYPYEQPSKPFANCSPYTLQTCLPVSLQKACKISKRFFDKCLKKISKSEAKKDDVLASIVHDTEVLLATFQYIQDMSMRLKELGMSSSNGIDYKLMEETIIKCMNLADKDRIIYDRAIGKSEAQIAKEFNRSRVYVRNKYKSALELLSYILWGYSVRVFMLE